MNDYDEFESILGPALQAEIERRAAEPESDPQQSVVGGELDGVAVAASPDMSAEDIRKLAEQAFEMLAAPEAHEAQTRCPECGSTTRMDVAAVEFITTVWQCSCGHVYSLGDAT